VFAAGAYTVLRVLGDKEQFYTVVFYFSFFTTVILLPYDVLFYKPMSLKQWVYLLLAGLFATVVQFGITVAFKYAPANEISILFLCAGECNLICLSVSIWFVSVGCAICYYLCL